jgi:hypothetical protein
MRGGRGSMWVLMIKARSVLLRMGGEGISIRDVFVRVWIGGARW